MGELSVNISGSERAQIERNAIELFMKTARARHPDETFFSELPARIFEETLNRFEKYIDTPLYSQLNFEYRNQITNRLSSLRLPDDLNVYTLNDSDSSHRGMLLSNRYLGSIVKEDFILDERFLVGNKMLFPFSRYGEDEIVLSDEIKNSIIEYNESMEKIYDELNKQLRTLIMVIDQCKTTKAFYARLPNLTTLFPDSLQRKINNKNAIEAVELTETEQLMQDATNVIATASLLGD